MDAFYKKGVCGVFPRIFKRYKELNRLAYHDSLTGLKNRNWFHQNKDNIRCEYVYFIDINRLHEINKKGHTFGDAHICSIVQRIKPVVDVEMIRYAGDEFIVFSNNASLLETDEFFAVGKAKVFKGLLNAINEADRKMIKEKTKPVCQSF